MVEPGAILVGVILLVSGLVFIGFTDLKKLKELAKAATPGPWRWIDTDSLVADHGNRHVVLSPCVESLGNYAMLGTRCEYSGRLKRIQPDDPNARFIAAANPQTVLALIERIEELEEALKGLLQNASMDWYMQQFGKDETPRGMSTGIVASIHNKETSQRIRQAFEEARAALKGEDAHTPHDIKSEYTPKDISND